MISWLKGKIINSDIGKIIINVNDIGYLVFVTRKNYSTEQTVELFIHQHIREDSSALYGFDTKEELDLFELLLSVSGVGPKLALSIIGSSNVKTIINAIESGSPEYFRSINGVGTKVAAKIIVELKNKISDGELNINSLTSGSELADGLQTLGYSKQEINKVIGKIPFEIVELKDKLQWAIKNISKKSSGSQP